MLIYSAWVWISVVFAVLWVVTVIVTILDVHWLRFRMFGYDRDVKALFLANRLHNIERLGSEKEYNNVRYRKAMCVGVVHAALGTLLLTGVLRFLNWLVWL
jgi:hypothetical protein